MQVTLRLARLAAIVAACLTVEVCATGAARPKPTPIEVWTGGDDGMTARLRDAIEGAFSKSSSDFILSSGKKQGTLIVTIPTHVRWKQIGRRTIVYYTVNFASVDHTLGARKGSCPDDMLSKCADQVLKHAKTAAQNIH
jgi:hypothetical protein